MLDPYDLGKNNLVEESRQLSIDKLLREAKQQLKETLIKSKLDVMGINVSLTFTKTYFDGRRLWFKCPLCQKRIHTLYNHPSYNITACRQCLGLRYKDQRYKGMIEQTV